VKIEKLVRALPRRVCHVCLRRLTIMPAMLDATAPSWPEPFGLVARARSERVHLVAGWCDIGNSIRQLRLRHRQRIEGFAQQLDLTSLCHQVPSEQLMERSPRRSSARVCHILGERLFRRLDEDMDIGRGECEVR